jgi:hypothetical protein
LLFPSERDVAANAPLPIRRCDEMQHLWRRTRRLAMRGELRAPANPCI